MVSRVGALSHRALVFFLCLPFSQKWVSASWSRHVALLCLVLILACCSPKVRVLHSHLPCNFLEHLSMGHANSPPTLITTQSLMHTLAVQTPHVCHHQWAGAVSTGCSTPPFLAPPRLGGPASSSQITTEIPVENLTITSSLKLLTFQRATRVLRPARRELEDTRKYADSEFELIIYFIDEFHQRVQSDTGVCDTAGYGT